MASNTSNATEKAASITRTTRSGRRKKPDKWANLVREKSEEHRLLLKKVMDLEDEQTSLRVKESLLVQVLDILQVLVADAADRAPEPCSSGHRPMCLHEEMDQDDINLMWLMVVSAVQEREQEIRSVYGQLLSGLYPTHQQQLHGVQVLTEVCSPENVPKVRSMTVQQVISRLSVLAGKCALQLLRESELQPGTLAADATISGQLQEAYMEFSTLVMSSMIWHNDNFRSIVSTNLDTLEHFEELLPVEHWVNVLQQLDLTDEQLQVLACVHDRHFWTGRLQLTEALDRNMQRQAANSAALAALMEPMSVQGEDEPAQPQDCIRTPVQEQEEVEALAAGTPPIHEQRMSHNSPGADASAAAGCASWQCASAADGFRQQLLPGAAHDHMVQIDELLGSQEVLMEEQRRLLQKWVLLGLHVGIVTICTLSTYQQAIFVVTSYPSVPRMDMVMSAYKEQKRQQQDKEGQQQTSPSKGRSKKAGTSTPDCTGEAKGEECPTASAAAAAAAAAADAADS